MADLSSNSLGLLSAGIDYLTLTSVSSSTKRRMGELFDQVSAADRQLGYVAKPGGAYGFFGRRTRHCLWAEKDGREMLQVSSDQAQRAIMLCRPGDNCTRIDIQATFRVAPGTVNSMLAAWCAEARSAPAMRGIRPKTKAIEGDHGVETVFIGRRASDVFIRLYDKFEESSLEEYRDCVRLEVEIKGKTAKALWEHCAQNGLGTTYLLGVLRTLLERRGLSLAAIDWVFEPKALPIKEKTCLERTRAWWASQVAPSVARDVAEWGMFTAFRILFERALTQSDFTGIMNAASLAWGN